MIFALSATIQKKMVKAYCFGCCQKLMIGGIDMGNEYGRFVPCREEDCEYEIGRTPVIGEAFGDEVCIRRLRDVALPG
ncbi:MAG TPA: hypothetical protein ENH07_10285 [Nitrospirae bacterium]|nr:hypothetical protein [Nitrospirota bacterium]